MTAVPRRPLPPLVRRLVVAAGTILLAMTFTFFLVRQIPGDVIHTRALQIQMQQGITYEEARRVAATMLSYDPSVPAVVQYFRYMDRLLLHGELGWSLTYRIPVTTIIAHALPWTLLITLTAGVLSFVAGVLIGTTLAWRRKTWLDPLVTLYATVTQAVPDFLIGLLLMIGLGLTLRILPMRGAYGPLSEPGLNLTFMLDVAWHAVLPILAFALPATGNWILAMRASATSVLAEDYVQVARAKGLKEGRIRGDYVRRNAIMPLVTGLAASLGGIFGGSMLVEAIFGYPGVGYFLSQAIATRDYTLMQGLFLLTTVAVVLANLAGDVIAAALDPRIRVE